MDPDNLKRFLVELPGALNYSNYSAIPYNLHRALYYSATGNGAHIHKLFPDHTASYDFSTPIDTHPPKTPFYNAPKSQTYSHPPGKVCARVVPKGEAMYRCRQCGHDDTCVLCAHCFNKKDHIGHEVMVNMSLGNGLCDCGDLEAFPPLECRCSADIDTDNPFTDPVTETIRVCIDYVLDVTNFSVQTLPFVHRNQNALPALTASLLLNYSSLPRGRYGTEDRNSAVYVLVLWNDEHHNFKEAQTAIMAATGVTAAGADVIAMDISLTGRAILKRATNYTELLEAKELAEINGLVASVMSARDYSREIVVLHVLQWICDAILFASNTAFRETCKTVLANVLLEPGHKLSKTLPTEFFAGLSVNIERKLFENALLDDGRFVNYGVCKVDPHVSASEYNGPVHTVLTTDRNLQVHHSRIQYLLLFQVRMMTSARKKLGTLMAPLIADTESKAAFTQQMMEVYPVLLTTMALADREDHLNCLIELSTQLLSCPTSVHSIRARDEVGRILGPLARLIEEHSAQMNPATGYYNFVERPATHTRLLYIAVKRAILRGMHDLLYVSAQPEARAMFLLPENLPMLLLYLRAFQDYCPMERKYGNHVETELFEYAVHFEYSIKVLETVHHIAASELTRDEAVRAIREIVAFLMLRPIQQSAPGIVDFRVSKDSVAFVHPIHTLLSYLVKKYGLGAFDMAFEDSTKPFVNISDISLRSVVLGSQIKAGFWIRNGICALRQASLYANSKMTDATFFCDLHIQQVALCLDNPRTTLYNFLDRWELLQWYRGEVDWTKTIYEERFPLMVEKFVVFLYNLLTDRGALDERKEPRSRTMKPAPLTDLYDDFDDFGDYSDDEEIEGVGVTASRPAGEDHRTSLAYFLCDAPKSFSQISSHVHAPDLEEILYLIADYQAPTGLADVGLYRLKASVYEELDPMSLHLDLSKFQVVSDALFKNIAKNRHTAESDVVLMPVWKMSTLLFVNERLGRFTRTKDFVKLVYKLLQVAIDASDETYLAQLLHLLHACIVDDERLHGDGFLRDDYVTISIGDLLLTIAELPLVLKRIQSKAEFLVEELVRRDSRVLQNLEESFGVDHVQTYKKRKTLANHDDTQRVLSEKRKAKVMRRFAKQREQFLSQNKEYDTPDTAATPEHLRACVYCGEPESPDEPFGIMATKTTPYTLWELPTDDDDYFRMAFAPYDHQASPKSPQLLLYGRGISYQHDGGSLSSVLSTCGHGIHYKCFDTEMRGSSRIRHVPCPLCHNLHEVFVPVFVPDANVAKVPVPTNVDDALADPAVNRSVGAAKCTTLSESVISTYDSAILKRIALVMLKEVVPLVDTSSKSFHSALVMLTGYIANTIRVQEIATRIDGPECFPSLLEKVPNTAKTLVRSLVQGRALIYELRGSSSLVGSNDTLELEASEFWKSLRATTQDPFVEVVRLFMQTDESLQHIVSMVIVKLVSYAVKQLPRVADFDIPAGFELSTDVQDTLREIVLIRGSSRFGTDKDAISRLYLSIERVVSPLLRQSVLFLDILSSTSVDSKSGDNLLTRLQDLVDEQAYPECVDALTTILGISSLRSLLLRIGTEERVRSLFDAGFNVTLAPRLPYTGVVKLIDLPLDYNECVMDDDNFQAGNVDTLGLPLVSGFDNIICLHCGTKVKDLRFLLHMGNCSNPTAIFFVPRLNNLKICIHIGHSPIHVDIPAPYLTQHGECKRVNTGGRATLNELRYKFLNQLWLTQSLYGFVTRRIFGSQVDAWSIDDQEEDDEDDIVDHDFTI